MATTKIFPITATVGSAIAYIAAAAKTDNGRLISTFMCSREPSKAAKEFAEVTATGTGRSTVIAQHFIMSFKPGGGYSRKSYGDRQGNVRKIP